MNELILSRRKFLVSASSVAGGLVISVSLPSAVLAGIQQGVPYASDASPVGSEFSAWISIAADDTVTVRVPTPEIGNGVMTQLPLTVAEELRCAIEHLNPEYASANRDYIEDGVYGKVLGALGFFAGRSTSQARTTLLLQVGASARERLKTAAANEWGVPVSEVVAENSVLTHTPSGKTFRFGEMAEKASAVVFETEPELKPEAEWTILGKTKQGKFTNPSIVKGTAIYGIDTKLDGKLYAVLIQSPVQGGTLVSYDFDAIKDMPGVHSVVTVDPAETREAYTYTSPMPVGIAQPQSAVAVVADHYWQARKAAEALPIVWDAGEGAKWKDTEMIKAASFAALDGDTFEVQIDTGDRSAIDSTDGIVVESDFWTPYSDQSPMEVLNGCALVTDDRVDLWHPSQLPSLALHIAAAETGVPPENVHVHQTLVGGGFGRRVFGDDSRMVVAVAKKVKGRPVHVVWSREEQLRQGRYRPSVAGRYKAVLGDDGMPKAIKAQASGTGMFLLGLVEAPLFNGFVPNTTVETANPGFHLLSGPCRGPGYNSFTFMQEVFVDEMAHAAGVDPLEYRLRMFKDYPDAGWEKVMRVATTAAGWGKELPKGQALGMAVANWGMTQASEGVEAHFGTSICTVARVEVSQAGELKVLQLDVAFDTGKVMNSEAVEVELQGGTIFGLSQALNEELNVKDGAIVEGNFDTYKMLRTADIPPINIHFEGLTGADRWGEIGEPPVGVVAPAIANAVFQITGKRLRSMPFNKLDLSWS